MRSKPQNQVKIQLHTKFSSDQPDASEFPLPSDFHHSSTKKLNTYPKEL